MHRRPKRLACVEAVRGECQGGGGSAWVCVCVWGGGGGDLVDSGVVDDLVGDVQLLAGVGRAGLVRHLHRPLHAPAVPVRLRQHHLHVPLRRTGHRTADASAAEAVAESSSPERAASLPQSRKPPRVLPQNVLRPFRSTRSDQAALPRTPRKLRSHSDQLPCRRAGSRNEGKHGRRPAVRCRDS